MASRTGTAPPRLLTVQQTADLLAIKSVTVRAWLSRRVLPRVKLRRCVRIPADAVAEFVAVNTSPAKSAAQSMDSLPTEAGSQTQDKPPEPRQQDLSVVCARMCARSKAVIQ
jgi:excisionase family DNA binding protein